ncbi:hypothetical protein Gotur_022706 [Gossypium turneri]
MSADSSNSKRSFNSHSSKNQSNSSKKRTSNQKTLGMAWGSNSLSSSRSSFRSSPFSDFGRSFSSGLPVVKPMWILDSVAANKLLSWVPYQLDQLANNQPTLSAFFTTKCNPADEGAFTNAICEVKHENEVLCLKDASKDASFSEAGNSFERRKQATEENDELMYENTDKTVIDGPSNSYSEEPEEVKVVEQSNLQEEDESMANDRLQACPEQSSSSVSSRCFDNHGIRGSPTSTVIGPSKHRHSTLGDPNFVENYFKLYTAGSFNYCRIQGCISLEPGEIDIVTVFLVCQMDLQSLIRMSLLVLKRLPLSILTWSHPELNDKPVAVCHSDNPKGTAEISSANYTARDYGIKAGMFVRDAKSLCPQLVILPYNFEAYEEVNHQLGMQFCCYTCIDEEECRGSLISLLLLSSFITSISAFLFLLNGGCACQRGNDMTKVVMDGNCKKEDLELVDLTKNKVADQFYNILHKHCNRVQAVSCDEAFLDVTDLEGKDPQLLASAIRKEISEATGCTASAGIAENMLMARLATRTAKPNGQCYIHPERVDEYLDQLPIKVLPGIGHVLAEKLKNKNVRTCGELRLISKDSLQKYFGIKTGEMLWNYSRGMDNRLVGMIQESKSVGAEVNWGVRFRDLQHAQRFLLDLCKEVSLRLQGCGVQGRTFTLKIKKRRKDAGEPAKFMGCGDCENLSHSTTVPLATDDIEVLQRISKQLFGSFHIDVKDIRGVGLQVSRLESADTSRQAPERNSLKSWLMSASASSKQRFDINRIAKECVDSEGKSVGGNSGVLCIASVENSVHETNNAPNGEGGSNQSSSVPPLCHLDMGVVENLPSELLSELNEIYDGKLVELITKRKVQGDKSTGSACFFPPEPAQVAVEEAERSRNSASVSLRRTALEMKDTQHILEELRMVPDSEARPDSVAISTAGLENNDLVPSSLSQVDTSVLQQLPEDLRADIFEALPAHRMPEGTALGPRTDNMHPPLGIKTATDNQPGSTDSGLSNNLWIGDPPLWVDKFKVSKLSTLNFFVDMYYKANSAQSLSSILQCIIAESLHPLNARCDAWNEAIHSFSVLLMNYIKLKIVVDIEEIYVCFRLLRRLSTKSQFFLEVYNLVFPHLQASVDENYGGTLHIPPIK